MKMMKKGWLFSILLALAMVIGLMPGMGIKAYADTAYGTYLVTSQDDAAALENKKVKFNNLEWYIIEDNSTSDTEGTLTLLAAGTDFGLSMFKQQFNYYKNSIIALALADYTEEGGSFYSVADAIKEVTLSDAEDLKVKLYLPSKDEVASLNDSDVLKLKFEDNGNMLQGWGWWLRSRGSGNIDSLVSYVIGSLGTVDEKGAYGNNPGGVRPALQLKLDAVTFDSASKTFSMNAAKHAVTVAASPAEGGTAEASPAEAAEGEKVTLTATATDGYEFVNWTLEGDGAKLDDAASPSATLTMGTADVTATANFKKKEEKKEPVVIPDASVTAHVQRIGWMDPVTDGTAAGTTGRSRRMEALTLKLPDGVAGGIEYRGHVQRSGWEKTWAADGNVAGTTGKSRRVEAVQIQLTGEAKDAYDVYYRVHVQRYGWMGWAKNGEEAGTQGMSRRAEAIQVVLVAKDAPAPDATYKGVTQQYAKAFVKK